MGGHEGIGFGERRAAGEDVFKSSSSSMIAEMPRLSRAHRPARQARHGNLDGKDKIRLI
jgi:hypothetical protein